jgi:hypothetical protein
VIDLLIALGLELVACSVCGAAIRGLAGLSPQSRTTPAVGFAAVIAIAQIAVRLPGRATTAVVALALGCGLSAAYLGIRRRPRRPRRRWPRPPAAAALMAFCVLLLELIPFGVSERVGLLGVGTNDDMSHHLLAAWTLQGHAALGSDKLIASGYPIGPHALAATIAQATGIPLERAFTSVTLGSPVLLALAASALLINGPRGLRGGVAVAVGLCYLQAAYLVQASFKEPMEALIVVAFAAGLDELQRDRPTSRWRAAPLAVLAAGSIYVYSYPGLLWLGGTLILWAALRLARSRPVSDRARSSTGEPTLAWPFAGGVFVALAAPEIPRLIRFHSSGFNHEGSGVLGNMLHALPPLEGLGIWPRLDFRFDLPLGSVGGILSLLALAVLLLGFARSVVGGRSAVAAAMLMSATLYAASTPGSPYTAAKLLAIAAPLATLLIGQELLNLLDRAHRVRSWTAFTAATVGAIMLVGAYSDLEVLRDGPVGPNSHANQLEALRAVIGKRLTLFLGSDNYVHWKLRGANIATPPAPLYTGVVVPLRRTKAQQTQSDYPNPAAQTSTSRFAGLGLAFDFDSVPVKFLDRFAYVIVPRSGYASQPPSNWQLVRTTRSYELWRRSGHTSAHQTLTEVDNPGATLNCETSAGRELASSQGMAMVRPFPVVGVRHGWHGAIGYAGESAHQYLLLGRGTWEISLQYDSSVPVLVRGPRLHTVMPPTLEPLGPYWYVGKIHVSHDGYVRLVVTYGPVGPLGRFLGALGLTRAPAPTGLQPLGRITAAKPGPDQAIPLRDACGRYVDWYRAF